MKRDVYEMKQGKRNFIWGFCLAGMQQSRIFAFPMAVPWIFVIT